MIVHSIVEKPRFYHQKRWSSTRNRPGGILLIRWHTLWCCQPWSKCRRFLVFFDGEDGFLKPWGWRDERWEMGDGRFGRLFFFGVCFRFFCWKWLRFLWWCLKMMWLSVVLCYDGPFLSLWLYDSRMMFNMNGSIGSPYILVRLVNVSRFGPTSLCQPFLTPLQCFGCASSDQLTPSCLFFFVGKDFPGSIGGPLST